MITSCGLQSQCNPPAPLKGDQVWFFSPPSGGLGGKKGQQGFGGKNKWTGGQKRGGRKAVKIK
jgi:hypothetical protein